MDATAFSKDQEIRVQRVLRELKGTDHDKRIIGPVTEYEGTISIAGTEVRTRPIVFPAGMTEVRIVPQEEGVTPQSLDPNAKDDRILTVGLKRVRLEPMDAK